MNSQTIGDRWNTWDAEFWSTVIATRSVVRCLPLFFAARPQTPLRVLCLIAFDTLHRLRHAQRLPTTTLTRMALFLDFAACVNATLDHKQCSPHELQATRQQLDADGIGPALDEYLNQLRDLETRRPTLNDDQQFPSVVAYREAIVRLSLGMLATISVLQPTLDGGLRATRDEPDLNLLFRIVMQCQIIDDVFDYSSDRAAGLPSFLTVPGSLAHGFEWTREAAQRYATLQESPQPGHLFPLRAALCLVSTGAKLILSIARWKS